MWKIIAQTEIEKKKLIYQSVADTLQCARCAGGIVDRSISALGTMFHPNCFWCTVCQKVSQLPVYGVSDWF